MPIYDTVRRDFEYLEGVAELDDCVEIDAQVFDLLRNPTKRKAAEIYEGGICAWFGEHKSTFAHDPEVRRIADTYGCSKHLSDNSSYSLTMSDCDTSIKITGEITSQESLDLLVKAILKDQPTPDWSSPPIFDENEVIEHLRNTLESGEELLFSENERRGDRFPEIEKVCRKLGLAYILTVSVDEEFDTSGHREVYDPKVGKVERYDGMDTGADTLVKAKTILDLLNKDLVEEAKKALQRCMNPEENLPDEFSMAPGLIVRSAAQP